MKPLPIALALLAPALLVEACPGTSKDDALAPSDDSGMERFDDCAGLLDAPADATLLLSTNSRDVDLPIGEATVYADETAFHAFWTNNGLEGEPPEVDFADSQVVAVYTADTGCRFLERVEGFYEGVDDGILGRVYQEDPCARCDTSGPPLLEVWSIRRTSVTLCRFGQRCK